MKTFAEVERAYQRSDMLERRREMMVDWTALFLSGHLEQPKAISAGAAT